MQAVCDAHKTWHFVSVDCPGSAHDSTALRNSALFPALESLPEEYYIAADAAYKAIPRCLVPYEGRGQNDAEQSFSFFLSSLRITVECAFCLLVLRWGVLWRPLRCTLQRNVLVVRACFALHNFCEARAQRPPLAPPEGERSVRLDERPLFDENGEIAVELSQYETDDYADPVTRAHPSMVALRTRFTQQFAALGLQRMLPRGLRAVREVGPDPLS